MIDDTTRARKRLKSRLNEEYGSFNPDSTADCHAAEAITADMIDEGVFTNEVGQAALKRLYDRAEERRIAEYQESSARIALARDRRSGY